MTVDDVCQATYSSPSHGPGRCDKTRSTSLHGTATRTPTGRVPYETMESIHIHGLGLRMEHVPGNEAMFSCVKLEVVGTNVLRQGSFSTWSSFSIVTLFHRSNMHVSRSMVMKKKIQVVPWPRDDLNPWKEFLTTRVMHLRESARGTSCHRRLGGAMPLATSLHGWRQSAGV